MDFMSKIMDAFHEKYGEDAEFEENEVQVFELNDCIVVVSVDDDRELKVQVLGDKPIKVDCTTGLFVEKEEV